MKFTLRHIPMTSWVFEKLGDHIGVIGPHNRREADLLLCGAKPMGFLNAQYDKKDIARLMMAVHERKLVHRVLDLGPVVETGSKTTLWYWPQRESEAQGYVEKMCSNSIDEAWELRRNLVRPLSDRGTRSPLLRRFAFGAYYTFCRKAPQLAFSHTMQWLHKIENNFTSREQLNAVLSGNIGAAETRQQAPPDVLTRYNSALTQGILNKIDYYVNVDKRVSYFFAQPHLEDKLDLLVKTMSSHLLARYQPIHREEIGPVAEFLGYTERDEKLFHGETSIFKKHLFALFHTPIRAARQRKMLREGPAYKPR